MRISVRPDDPGFVNLRFGTKIFLNDEPVKLCVTADEEEGFVEVYDRRVTDEGYEYFKFYKDEDGETRVLTKNLYGKVKICLPEEQLDLRKSYY